MLSRRPSFPRPLFARLLIALLVALWAIGPAHCLTGLAGNDMAICRAVSDAPDAPPGLTLDHACPACAGLAWAPAPPRPVLPPVPVVWVAPLSPVALPIAPVRTPRLAPWQSRAPPSIA